MKYYSSLKKIRITCSTIYFFLDLIICWSYNKAKKILTDGEKAIYQSSVATTKATKYSDISHS